MESVKKHILFPAFLEYMKEEADDEEYTFQGTNQEIELFEDWLLTAGEEQVAAEADKAVADMSRSIIPSAQMSTF